MLLTEYLYKYSLIRVMSTYSGCYFPVIVLLIGYTVIGFLISIKTFYIEYKKEGKWIFDKVKIFLLFIPSLILAFIPFEYISMISDFDISNFRFNNSIVFSILAGYILANSLSKDSIDNSENICK